MKRSTAFIATCLSFILASCAPTSESTFVDGVTDALDNEGYSSSGSKASPLVTEVKGRGNYTWIGFDKKPYRIKFEEKQEIMGMKPNKHFALIAHASGYTTYLTEAAGFELGKMIGLAWTPDVKPLELVVNNEYLGIYFLTEHIRIDENRVNIKRTRIVF